MGVVCLHFVKRSICDTDGEDTKNSIYEVEIQTRLRFRYSVHLTTKFPDPMFKCVHIAAG